MQIRDRIKELRRVRADSLRPHPKNWRTHPNAQRDALRGVLADVGYADALLARELDDGQLELIDGHLRAETTPDAEVPVLVLDVSAEEADKILLTHDPLAALAGIDQQRVDELQATCEFDHPQVEAMLDGLAQEIASAETERETPRDKPNVDIHEVDIPESYEVVVQCDSEGEQQEIYQRMTEEGYRCRVLTL